MADATAAMQFEKCIALRETIKKLEDERAEAERRAADKPADNSAEIGTQSRTSKSGLCGETLF
jgi:hypothetical protein